MNKFTTGLIAGGLIGAVGLTYALTDKRSRRRMARDGKKMMHKANHLMDKMDW